MIFKNIVTYKVPKFCCRYTFEEIETIAKYLKNKIKIVPKVGIICGSGLECFDIFYRQSHFQYFVKTLLDKVTYGADQQEQDTKTIFVVENH
jgi:purine nucleoside phosphorylase